MTHCITSCYIRQRSFTWGGWAREPSSVDNEPRTRVGGPV